MIRPITASVIVGHSKRKLRMLTSIVGDTDFKWVSNDEKAQALEVLVSNGVLKLSQEATSDWYRTLVRSVEQRIRRGGDLQFPSDVKIELREYIEFTLIGAEFMLACQPLGWMPDGGRSATSADLA
jgi:hypothetical protein